MRDRKRKKAARRTLAVAVLVLFAIVGLIVLAFSRVFIVREVMVVGNRNLLKEEVVTQSGIVPGDRLLSITSHKLRERLESNRYIEYVGHDFDYRGTLTIRINERLGMAVVRDSGLFYVLDASGMVLECTGGSYPLTVAGPRVDGFDMENNYRVIVGERMPVRNAQQLSDMKRVIEELDATGLLSKASDLNVRNLDNIYVMTSGGAKVELGDTSNLHVKLLIAREVIAKREEEGDMRGAKIDVSNGVNAHYIPSVLPTPTPVPTPTPTPTEEPTPEP